MKNDVICWDSSVVIGWLLGPEDEPDRTTAIEPVIDSIEKGAYSLAVSSLLYVEILESKMPSGTIEKFEQFMRNREELEIIAVGIRVARKAQTIRNQTNIKTPDAVHIATAIVVGAKFFHTFDNYLLNFNGKNEVEKLAITACDIPGVNLKLSL